MSPPHMMAHSLQILMEPGWGLEYIAVGLISEVGSKGFLNFMMILYLKHRSVVHVCLQVHVRLRDGNEIKFRKEKSPSSQLYLFTRKSVSRKIAVDSYIVEFHWTENSSKMAQMADIPEEIQDKLEKFDEALGEMEDVLSKFL